MFVTSNDDVVVRLRAALPGNWGFRKRYEKSILMDRMRFEETTWANWESYVAIIIFARQCFVWYRYVIDTRMD
jgi:hypothetical protein